MITFGIISSDDTCGYIPQIIKDIRALHIEEYQILIVGPHKPFIGQRICQIMGGEFTTKKNMVTNYAHYDTIVYMHDYITFLPTWYEEWRAQLDSFDIAMNRIECLDNTRFRDLCYWNHPACGDSMTIAEPWCPKGMTFDGRPCLPNYKTKIDVSRIYVSGTYWIAKKAFMKKYPLNESIKHCQGEDLEFCLRWRENPNVRFVFNEKAVCKLLKIKDAALPLREDII